jgi:tryptophanyl-tRNA synthetase
MNKNKLKYLMSSTNQEQETKKEEKKESEKSDFIVTPWDVAGTIDYKKLIEKFGTQYIDPPLLEKFKKVTGKELHPWLKRGIYFTHRAFDKFLDAYAEGDPVFLYTGRGPSTEAMHIGHLIPFIFTKWMQDTFNCPLVIQISDEEKAAFKHIEFDSLHKMGFENAKEIISCGFDVKKTFIFSNRDYRLKCQKYENFSTDFKNNTTIKSIQSIFGLNETGNIFMYNWPVYQSVAAFWQAYPHIFGNRPAVCCVPHAIDQDPYFRLARDVAPKMNLIKPTNIMCSFIPPITGQDGKMSSSKADATIFLTDDKETLRKKIMTSCKSGKTPEDDIAYQYLRYFEMDDDKLEKIRKDFISGELTPNGIKEILVEKIWEIMDKIQTNRKKIDEKVLNEYYELKPIELPKPKMKEVIPEEKELYDLLDKYNIKHVTKYHSIISTIDQFEDLEQKINGTICKGLLLKAKEGYIYYIINEHTTVNIKLLAKSLKLKVLRFAESDTYQQILKVNSKTCPSIFAIKNDNEKKIMKVLIDDNIDKNKRVCSLALRQDGTCSIEYNDIIKYLKELQYEVQNL